MKYCVKCGKELFDEAVICPGCGCPAADKLVGKVGMQTVYTEEEAEPRQETAGLAKASIVCALLVPLVGFILGIVGACKYRNPKFKDQCKTSIFVSVVVEFIVVLLFWTIASQW